MKMELNCYMIREHHKSCNIIDHGVNLENAIHKVFLLKSERSWNFVFIYKAVIKDPLEEEKKGDS